MAKMTRLSPLKALRSNTAMTTADIAEAMRVPESTVIGWERTLEGATPLQLRDLAYLMGAPVEMLLGREASEKEKAAGTFAAHAPGARFYGTLKLTLADRAVEYPIDEDARQRLLNQIEESDIQEHEKQVDWVNTTTMDNRFVFANLSYVLQLELVGDDVEQMPEYEHPEVYNALEDWELEHELGPAIRRRCEHIFEARDRREVVREATHARMIMSNGDVVWHPMHEGADTTAYFLLDLQGGLGLARNRLVPVVSEDYYRVRYVNLSNVAVIEAPANRYFRLLAEDDEQEGPSAHDVSPEMERPA